MVSVETLKQEVKELKTQVNPQPKHMIINFGLSNDAEPHGFLNGQLFHWVIEKHGQQTRWYEALNSETELQSNRAYYDQIISQPHNKFMKEPTHPFHSWESFLKHSRCNCGKHGADNMQPFLGDA